MVGRNKRIAPYARSIRATFAACQQGPSLDFDTWARRRSQSLR